MSVLPLLRMTDHEELVSLVPENSGSNAVVDACKRCLGYVKTLRGFRAVPRQLILDDLASVELDVAAADKATDVPKAPAMV